MDEKDKSYSITKSVGNIAIVYTAPTIDGCVALMKAAKTTPILCPKCGHRYESH